MRKIKTFIISFCSFLFLVTVEDIYSQQITKYDSLYVSTQRTSNSKNEKRNFINGHRNYGVDFSANFTNDLLSNVSGGISTGSSYISLFEPVLTIDLSKALNWRGADLLISGIGTMGDDFYDEVGAEQGVDNIEAYHTWKIYELWLEQNLFNKALSLKFGLYDLNSEFDARQSSSVFLNPSHGIGAEYALSGKNGPSIFPSTSLALRIKYNDNLGYYFQTALLDGVPDNPDDQSGTQIILNKKDGLLLAVETGLTENENNFGKGYEKFSVGGWYFTGNFRTLLENYNSVVPVYQKGNYGVYLSGEKFLWSKPGKSDKGIAVFFRAGVADNNVNKVDKYFGAGINCIGLIPGRDKDEFGIALAAAHNNSKYVALMKEDKKEVRNYESIIEITYLFHFTDWLKVQPDLQYVFNPANCLNNNHSIIVGMRGELTLNY